MGGREGKKRRLPGLLRARGSPTGSRPLAAAVRRSVRGDVRRRALGWAGAPAAAAARGQIWRLAAGKRSLGETLRTRGPSGADPESLGLGLRLRSPSGKVAPCFGVTRSPSLTGRRKAWRLSQDALPEVSQLRKSGFYSWVISFNRPVSSLGCLDLVCEGNNMESQYSWEGTGR